MTQEFRVRHTSYGWCAELRFDATDDELAAAGILPGWHPFKRSVRRETVDAAAALAFEQAAHPKRFLA
jgi:hypothetical protein